MDIIFIEKPVAAGSGQIYVMEVHPMSDPSFYSACGLAYFSEELTEANGHFLCPDCPREETLIFSHCSRRILIDDNAGDSGSCWTVSVARLFSGPAASATPCPGLPSSPAVWPLSWRGT